MLIIPFTCLVREVWLQMFESWQVRDFRKCTSGAGLAVSSSNGPPVVHKVHLRMSLENVVKDIPLISDSTWTYGDLIVSMMHSSHL